VTDVLDDLGVAAANIAAAGWPIGPRENPCVCGQPWHTHQGGLPDGCTGYEHDHADQLAQRAAEADHASLLEDMAAYDDHLHQLRRAEAGPRPPGPRVSDVGRCRRQVWYRETPPEGYIPRTGIPRRAASMGTALHDKAALARSWRYPWRSYDMQVQVPGLEGNGYIDEYDPITGTVIDFKTFGEWKWENVGDYGPPDEAVDQAMIYGLALEAMGLPVNRICILGVRRSNGDEELFWYLYDPARAQHALEPLLALADSIELGVTPARDGAGPSDWRCKSCPALNHCWQTEEAAAAGRSPQSWIALGDNPDRVTIAWAAGTVWELGKAAAGAKAAHEQAKLLLEGVPAGTYGEYEVSNRSRKMPEYKATHNRNLGYWSLDPQYRPSYDVVAQPEVRVDRWVQVGRVRASQRQQPVTPPPVDEHLDTIA
jgi:hypothetical protein